jgi:hypothetical protein
MSSPSAIKKIEVIANVSVLVTSLFLSLVLAKNYLLPTNGQPSSEAMVPVASASNGRPAKVIFNQEIRFLCPVLLGTRVIVLSFWHFQPLVTFVLRVHLFTINFLENEAQTLGSLPSCINPLMTATAI